MPAVATPPLSPARTLTRVRALLSDTSVALSHGFVPWLEHPTDTEDDGPATIQDAWAALCAAGLAGATDVRVASLAPDARRALAALSTTLAGGRFLVAVERGHWEDHGFSSTDDGPEILRADTARALCAQIADELDNQDPDALVPSVKIGTVLDLDTGGAFEWDAHRVVTLRPVGVPR